MQQLWTVPEPDDRCALCGGPILPNPQYVLTFDAEGERLWWHMACRDVMIPVLASRPTVYGREPAGEDVKSGE
jgi:hypothetical protein